MLLGGELERERVPGVGRLVEREQRRLVEVGLGRGVGLGLAHGRLRSRGELELRLHEAAGSGLGWGRAPGPAGSTRDLTAARGRAPHEALAGRRYRFEWVKGHVGHELNEAADFRARAVAEAYQRGLEIPAGPGWSGACETETDATAAAPALAAAPAPAEALVVDASDPEVTPTADDDALFSLDEAPEAWHSVTLELSTEELDRLRVRAQAEGLSPEEFLRGLI